jgi:hypothetical protein
MKLSEYALTVLKNFSTINSSVILNPGNLQCTMAPDDSIVVEAELEEITPEKFSVYDLNQFLGNVTTLNNPELTFTSKTATMDDGSTKLTYYSCAPGIIKSPPEGKSITLKNPDYSFLLTNSTLSKLKKIADMNELPHISLVCKNGVVRLQAHERKNDTSNYASSLIEENSTYNDFFDTFKAENFKLIPDDYDVQVKHDAFAIFTSTSKKLKYVIAMEAA